MSLLSRVRLALACVLALAILSAVQVGDAVAQKGDFDKKSVTFNSVDGVELKGTYWTPTKAKKNASVLLLHNFSKQKGGTSHDDGWDALAEELATEGYNVLSFDFRGHGESKNLGKNFFDQARFPHNMAMLKGTGLNKGIPTSLDAKDFQKLGTTSYYPHMVDDIAAAKAFLDNKAKDSGAANVIVIGAGEGATLGAMWMDSEFHRYRDKTEGNLGQPMLDTEPEAKDLVAGVWLSLSPTLDGRQVPIMNWLSEMGGPRNKLPMLFMYGQNDAKGSQRAGTVLGNMMRGYRLMGSAPGLNTFNPSMKFTRDWAVKDTQLEGSQLLQGSLDTNKIIKAYINNVMEDRGSKENKRHDAEKYRYYWITSQNQTTPAKTAGEELMLPINPKNLGILR